jgi:hypothetical protein
VKVRRRLSCHRWRSSSLLADVDANDFFNERSPLIRRNQTNKKTVIVVLCVEDKQSTVLILEACAKSILNTHIR